MSLKAQIAELAAVDLFKEARQKELFIGRPFSVDYQSATLLVADAWKMQAEAFPMAPFYLPFMIMSPLFQKHCLCEQLSRLNCLLQMM